MNKILDLALSYFKVGLFTFGGGLAMISIIEREYVEKRKWIDKDEFENIVAIADAVREKTGLTMAMNLKQIEQAVRSMTAEEILPNAEEVSY